MMTISPYINKMFIAVFLSCALAANLAYAQDDNTRNVLKQGLLGAGTDLRLPLSSCCDGKLFLS